MSLARAFTTRRSGKRAEISGPVPQRSLTTKHSFASGTIRHQISGPVELISTTNMLSYNAPDIYPNSASSGDESDRSATRDSTPPTSPDRSSAESSPTSIEHNHLSCYFGTAPRHSVSGDEAPKIPQRAPSHTKKNHESLSRQRSVSRMSASKSSMSTGRSSIGMFSANVDTVEPHPFFKELAQVSELAEEFGISREKMAVVDEEEQELVSRGLFKFRAEDYISEIHGLFMSAFGDSRPTMSSMWI